MLMHQAGLRAGETVLVVGAGGGVNSVAVQIAKLAGATVYTVASSAEKAEQARQLGADVVLDRSQVDWGKEIFKLTSRRGVDVVVDNVGQATITTSMQAAARGGRIVIVGNTSGPQAEIDIRFIFGKQISLIGSTMGSHQDFRDVLNLLWAGKIKPVILVLGTRISRRGNTGAYPAIASAETRTNSSHFWISSQSDRTPATSSLKAVTFSLNCFNSSAFNIRSD